MDGFAIVGTPKERHEVCGLVCDALAETQGPGHSSFYKRPEYLNPVPTAFAIALRENVTDLINHMLKTFPMVSCGRKKRAKIARTCPLAAAEAFDISSKLPLERTMMHGRTEQAKMLLSHGARIEKDPEASPFFACRTAAKLDYEDVVELYLELLPWDYNNVTLHSIGSLVTTAAIAHHWDMLFRMLRRCMLRLRYMPYVLHWSRFLSEAATDGKDTLICYILDALRPSFDITHPLSGAAHGGRLGTCRLLLEKGSIE